MSLCFPPPLLPSPSRAAQKRLLAGEHQLWCTQREVCAKIADTPREESLQCAQLTQADATAPGAHVGMFGDGYAVIPNTRVHTCLLRHAHRERDPNHHPACPPPRPSAQAHRPTQTDAYGATRTHTQTCTHIPAAHPPSASGGGSFAAHMEHRSSWAVLESGCGVGLGHLSQGIVHQPLYAPHPARTVTTPHGEVLPPTP